VTGYYRWWGHLGCISWCGLAHISAGTAARQCGNHYKRRLSAQSLRGLLRLTTSSRLFHEKLVWSEPSAVVITNYANSLTATCADKSSWFLSVNSSALELRIKLKLDLLFGPSCMYWAGMLSFALVLALGLSLRTKSQSLVLALALNLQSLVLSLALSLESLVLALALKVRSLVLSLALRLQYKVLH